MKKIPVYTIQTISCKPSKVGLFDILPFEEHLRNLADVHFPHRHDFYYLLYITNGKGSHTIDFKTYPLTHHQFFFMSPGQVHQWDIKAGTKGYTLFFDKELFDTPHFKIEEEWSFFHNFFNDAAFAVPKKDQQSIHHYFDTILQEYTANANKNSNKVITHLVSALLYKINDLIFAQKNASVKNNLHVIRRFELLIDKHFTKEHHTEFYASQLNISPNYLNALCKKGLGKSAKELVNARLLIESKRLLKHSSGNINSLSDYLNFTTTSYFVRFFKKHEGITPQQFRLLKNS